MLGARTMTLLFAAIAILAVVGLVILARSLPHTGQQIQTKQQPSTQNATANPETAKNNEQKTNEGTQTQETENYWKRFVRFVETRDKFINAFSTILMLIVTGFVAYATFSLYGATRDLVIGAEKTAERQLRAYVYVLPPPQGISAVIAGSSQRTVVALRNSGQTPAYEMQVRGNFGFGEYPPTANQTYNEGPYGALWSSTQQPNSRPEE
jgi:hypothetical protein